MKNDIWETKGDFNETFTETSIENIKKQDIKKQGSPLKDSEEIRTEAKAFFAKFSQKFRKTEPEFSKQKEEQDFLADVKELDRNTAPEPVILDSTKNTRLTKEDIQQLDENDPGYVNGMVPDYDNALDTEYNTYQETGLHTGVIRWGDYALKEGKEYVMLEKDTVLSRWGDENGTFMSDVNTGYDSLELPIIKEKNNRNFYIVVRSFPVEISKVAVQPWNKRDEESSDEIKEPALQYKMPVPVRNLVREGYLRRLGQNEDI